VAYLREHEVHVAADGGYTASVMYMENIDGRIMVEACRKCDHVKVTCEHLHNSWNAADTQLTCNLCGADGT
jgi:hypothetical protein